MAAFGGTSQSMTSPWAAGAAGAAGGAGAVMLGNKLKSINAKSNWALGIGVVLTALAVVSSSDLNSDQTTAQNLATSITGYSISNATTASLTTLSADVQALRSFAVQQANLSAKIAYDANFFAFNGTPVQQPSPVQAGTITALAQTTSSNNTAIIFVALAVLVLIVAIAM